MTFESSRISTIRTKLLQQDTIKVKNEWLQGCVEYFISEAPQISDEILYQQAKEQFLLADVKDASNPVIPAQILQKKEPFTQHGTFVLQLLYLIDIAESPYEQWRRIHNIHLDEVQDNRESKAFQSKKKRMFKLELTDGCKNISAMEYVTIPNLTKKTPPGSKVQIIGPIQVVNHILLLEPKNIKILGGDCEHLLIENAYENVLLRALGKPTTQTPITEFKDEPAVVEHQRVNGNNIVTKPMTTREVRQPTPPLNDLLDGIDFTEEDDVDMEMLMQIEQDERRFKESNNAQFGAMEVDEEIAELQELPAQLEPPIRQEHPIEVIEILDPPPRRTVKATDLLIPPIVIPDDDDESEDLNFISRRASHQHSDDPVPRKIARVEPTRVPTYNSDDYRFKSRDGYNLITIDQYLTMKATDKMRREYVVWGKVISVAINSLKIKNYEWLLFGNLKDSFSRQPLPVKFHNKILEKISGYTGMEMKALYGQAKSRPQVKDDILKIITNIRDKLVANLQFMRIKIEFAPDNDGPSNYELTEIIEKDEETHQTFLTKLLEENIKNVE